MDMELREKNKKRGIKRLFNSFKYSFQGLFYAYKFEQSLFIHAIFVILVVFFGIIFEIDKIEWLFCILFMGLVMATELINTSLEAVVDLVSPNIHPLAKIAKDTASAAVFIFSMTAAIAGLIIFVPKIIEFLR